MNTLRIQILCFVALFLVSFAKKNEKRKLMADKSESIVTYTMRHPLHEWEAVNKDVNCLVVYNPETEAIENVAVVLKVEAFDSKNSNRDSHALELLEALKYPKVTFLSNNVKMVGEEMLISGTLIFHGVAQPITFRTDRTKIANILKFEGRLTINLSDFKIERPSLLGMLAEDKIQLYFKVAFKL